MIYEPNIIMHVLEPKMDPAVLYDAPVTFTTHYLGENKFPLTTPGNSIVYLSHHSAEVSDAAFSGSVKKLTFNQLGSSETPYLRQYRSTCEVVAFSGKIHSIKTIFEIVNQLPKVTEVDIFIHSAQGDYIAEEFPPPQHFPIYTNYTHHFRNRIPNCINVKTLKITMEMDYFYGHLQRQHQPDKNTSDWDNYCTSAQNSLLVFTESLLNLAGEGFPNLENLYVELPENIRLYCAVQSLIDSCSCLRKKTHTTLQNVMTSELSTTTEEVFQTIYFHNPRYVPWTPNNENSFENYPTTFSNQFVPSSSSHYDTSYNTDNANASNPSPAEEDEDLLVTRNQASVVITYLVPPGFNSVSSRIYGHYIQEADDEFFKTSQHKYIDQSVSDWLDDVDEERKSFRTY